MKARVRFVARTGPFEVGAEAEVPVAEARGLIANGRAVPAGAAAPAPRNRRLEPDSTRAAEAADDGD